MEGLHLDRKFAHFWGNYGERRIGLGGRLVFGLFYFFGRYGDGEPVYSIVSWCMALVAAM